MNAEIIAVGSELLLGQIANTNAKYLSQELAAIGINVYYHTVVGDNSERLMHALEVAKKRANIIIFTGGLGPTKDDLTKETIAQALGLSLIIDEDALHSIELFFKKRKIEMTPNNRKQALVLEGAEVLPNETGMAPGMVISKEKMTYMLLPGPPSELEPMFNKYGRKALWSKMETVGKIQSRVLRFFGIGEAKLETELEDLFIKQTNPTLAPLASDGEVTIRITAKHEKEEIRQQLLDDIQKKILNRAGQYFYGFDETTLVKEMGLLLQKKHLTLAAAESLTGGLFQEEVTSIAGVSKWFKGGIVSYSNEAKINVLKVAQSTIEKYGAVSEETAKEMAANVRSLFQTDVGISFTGVAGPASLEGKEPGTVFIGLAFKDMPAKAILVTLPGNRESVRVRAVKHGAWKVIQAIKTYIQKGNN